MGQCQFSINSPPHMGRLGSGPASSVRVRVRTPRLGSIKARNAGYIVPVFSCGRSLYIDCRMMIGGNILRHVKRQGIVRVGKCPGELCPRREMSYTRPSKQLRCFCELRDQCTTRLLVRHHVVRCFIRTSIILIQAYNVAKPALRCQARTCCGHFDL